VEQHCYNKTKTTKQRLNFVHSHNTVPPGATLIAKNCQKFVEIGKQFGLSGFLEPNSMHSTIPPSAN
jgi:hypothetical protein